MVLLFFVGGAEVGVELVSSLTDAGGTTGVTWVGGATVVGAGAGVVGTGTAAVVTAGLPPPAAGAGVEAEGCGWPGAARLRPRLGAGVGVCVGVPCWLEAALGCATVIGGWTGVL